MSEFTPLRQLIPKAVNHYNLQKQVQGALVCHHFRKIARELWQDSIEESVAPRFYQQGILWLSVADSGWAQQIQFKHHLILEKLQSVCPEIPIKIVKARIESELFSP